MKNDPAASAIGASNQRLNGMPLAYLKNPYLNGITAAAELFFGQTYATIAANKVEYFIMILVEKYTCVPDCTREKSCVAYRE